LLFTASAGRGLPGAVQRWEPNVVDERKGGDCARQSSAPGAPSAKRVSKITRSERDMGMLRDIIDRKRWETNLACFRAAGSIETGARRTKRKIASKRPLAAVEN
jgi:hypothetical protein